MRHTSALIRSCTAAAVACAALVVPAAHASPGAGAGYTTTLRAAVAALPVAPERNEGYTRASFRHWVDQDGDHCTTRAEVLEGESLSPVSVGPGCTVTAGRWLSYYDGAELTDARQVDVDHVVPLHEAWGSGARAWDAQRRMYYANDLGDARALAAASAQQNRAKGGKGPGEWLPKEEGAHCRYAGEWTAVKLRWGLAADQREREALEQLARSCPDTALDVVPAGDEEGAAAGWGLVRPARGSG